MKKNMNQITADKLDDMRDELTEKALNIIAGTDINILHETFGGMTAEEINKMIEEW